MRGPAGSLALGPTTNFKERRLLAVFVFLVLQPCDSGFAPVFIQILDCDVQGSSHRTVTAVLGPNPAHPRGGECGMTAYAELGLNYPGDVSLSFHQKWLHVRFIKKDDHVKPL